MQALLSTALIRSTDLPLATTSTSYFSLSLPHQLSISPVSPSFASCLAARPEAQAGVMDTMTSKDCSSQPGNAAAYFFIDMCKKKGAL